MSTVHFTADEHFNYENIIKFCKRPFSNVHEMKEKLIENHNSVVKPGDRVIHVGDMFWRTTSLKEALEIRHRLNGEHFYIFGNHDEVFKKNELLRNSFVWCRDTENLNIKGFPNIFLFHYACRVWNGSHRGAWHLYGHSHAALKEVTIGTSTDESPFSFDIGVDAWNYYPVSLEQVADKMKSKGWPKEGGK